MTDHYKEFLDELELSYRTETHLSNYDTEVLWMPETDSLFIRGSDSIIDWFFNVLFWPDPLFGFHYGFKLKAVSLIKELKKEGIRPSTVVGHSSGGAVGQLVAYHFNAECYSLACPKTHRKNKSDSFSNWADEKLVIINQKQDLLSKLPPIILEHPVEPLWLNTENYFLFAHHLISFE